MSWPNKVYSRSRATETADTNDPSLVRSIRGKVVNGKILDAKGVADLTVDKGTSSINSITGTYTQKLKTGVATVVAANTAATAPYPQTANEDFTANILAKEIPNVVQTFIASSNANIGWALFINAGNTLFFETLIAAVYRYHALSVEAGAVFSARLISVKFNNATLQHSISVNGKPYSSGLALGAFGAITPTGLYLGGNAPIGTGSNGALSKLDNFVIYSGLKSDAWVREQWVKVAQAAQLKTGWGSKVSIANESTVGNFVGNGSTPFEILSGTWKVSTQTVDGELHKVIECVADGTVWLDRKFMNINSTEAAYGGWRFFVSHADNALPTTIALTATAKNTPAVTTGYFLRVYNTLTREGTYNAGIYTNFELLGTGGGATEPLEVQVRRRFDNVWQHHNRRIGQAWLTSTSDTEATYLTSEGMSITANAGDWISLGTVRDNFAFTKYLGEFDPSEV